MSGISPDLHKQLRQVLTDCGPFSDDRTLRAVFVDTRLSPWRNFLPQAQSVANRIEAVIDFLHDKNTDTQENALVLLLYVLRDRTDTGDSCHHRLSTLADQLAGVLNSPINIATPSPAEVTSSRDNEGNISIESPFGTMLPDSPFYIEREADRDGWNFLNQEQSATIYVQAPRQMGKSSLIVQLTHRAKQDRDLVSAYVDFERFSEKLLADEEAFLIEFCLSIGDALEVSEEIDRYWASRRRSNPVKCSNYVAQYLIPTFGRPFILAMDEVELVLTSPIRNDFFGMLRSWHNDRSWDANFAQLTLFLSSSTEPHLFIDNPNQSPFNVAWPLVLRDFTLAEVSELNRRHGGPLNPAEVDELVQLLGGHPFLTRLALYLVAAGSLDFTTLMRTASADSGPFGDHLRRYWQCLLDMPEFRPALLRICRQQTHPEDKLYYRLKGAGLIKKEGAQVLMRNKLYHQYFEERLNDR